MHTLEIHTAGMFYGKTEPVLKGHGFSFYLFLHQLKRELGSIGGKHLDYKVKLGLVEKVRD